MHPPVAKTVPLDELPPSRPKPGVVLGGRYVLEAPIQQGASGEVWRARHTQLGKLFAVKILKAEFVGGDDDWATKRMLREAKLVSEIDHSGVVNVIDYGHWQRCPYIVMELLVGRTLLEALRDGGAMTWAQAQALLGQIMESLAAAHRIGVIHRDIKPTNLVLLEGDETVKVIDFGIAGAPRRTRITTAGEVLGTPHFMSPEQTRTMDLSPASDVYSLGCVAYTMITGRPPFVGELGEIVRQHLHAPAPRLAERAGSDVPKAACAVLERCLAKRPTDRYASMEELYAALFGRPMPVAGWVPWTRRLRVYASGKSQASTRVVTAAIVAVLVSMGVTVGGLWMWSRGRGSAPPTSVAPMRRALPAAADLEVAAPRLPPAPDPIPVLEAALPVEHAQPKDPPPPEAPPPPARVGVQPDRPRKSAPATPLPREPSAAGDAAAPIEPDPAAAPEGPTAPPEEDGGLKNPFDEF